MSTYLSDMAEDLTVEGPSATFTYRRLGPRGGIPLVLLNRVRATIDWWDPEFLDHLAAGHDVIVFDNVGTGYTTGEPRDSVEGFADGTIEFIEAVGLPQVDLLGWTLGGTVALQVALRRPGLVRKLVVGAANPGGQVPGAPAADGKVRAVMAKPEPTADDLVYLFFPETDTGRAAGHAYLARVSARLAAGGPVVSEAAVKGQLVAIDKNASVPLDRVWADLETITHPVLCAAGVRDVMIPALASWTAVQHFANATLVAYGDAGHAFPFQHPREFAVQVTNFLAD
ncbi:alpha/beta fold hydrolase [Lentzea kentuckyensis]|uniref:alpha/beta fold hydrolase n=1 Tax=Lentzea kentuckyensis TaxID=360086 RepID=UPI000A397F77|nr:alpha/beta hydrolase [Lentzea kentuckyensis]